jgi:hypothetical protein
VDIFAIALCDREVAREQKVNTLRTARQKIFRCLNVDEVRSWRAVASESVADGNPSMNFLR